MRRMYDKEEIKEIAGEGSAINSLDLVVGEPIITYDTTDGIIIESTGKLNGTDDIVVSNEIPIIGTDGIIIDKAENSEKVEISGKNFVEKSTKPYIVYTTDSSGNQSTRFIASAPVANYMALYTDTGTLRTNPPIVNTDAANKKYVDDLVAKQQFKTLFGNQSIVGSGNIDLFCHNINFQDKVFFTAYSSNSLEINSLTDLQTVFPDDVWKSATGTSVDGTKVVCAINCSQMKVRYTDDLESSLGEYEAPVDILTTI